MKIPIADKRIAVGQTLDSHQAEELYAGQVGFSQFPDHLALGIDLYHPEILAGGDQVLPLGSRSAYQM